MSELAAELASLKIEVKYLKIIIPSACGLVALLLVIFWGIERKNIGDRVRSAIEAEGVKKAIEETKKAQKEAIEAAEGAQLALGQARGAASEAQKALLRAKEIIKKLEEKESERISAIEEKLPEFVKKADFMKLDWKKPELLKSGFIPYKKGYSDPQYTKDKFGIVHLRGLVGDNGDYKEEVAKDEKGLVFTLPTGYMPQTRHEFVVACAKNIPGEVIIERDGKIRVDAGDTTWVSLDNIQFYSGN